MPLENYQEKKRKLLEIINEYNKVTGYKSNTQIPLYAYTLTMKNQREIREKSIRTYQNFTERDKTPEE